MNITPGDQVTFELSGTNYNGHVTYTENGKATVMYVDNGLDLYVELEIDKLSAV